MFPKRLIYIHVHLYTYFNFIERIIIDHNRTPDHLLWLVPWLELLDGSTLLDDAHHVQGVVLLERSEHVQLHEVELILLDLRVIGCFLNLRVVVEYGVEVYAFIYI